MFELRIIDQESDLDGLGPVWDELLRESNSTSPYRSFIWQRAVWRHYLVGRQDVRLAICLVLDGAKVLAILPLIRRVSGRLLVRRLELLAEANLGMAGLGLIGDSGVDDRDPQVWTRLRTMLVAGGSWDELRLGALAPGRVPAWAKKLGERTLRFECISEERNPVLPLPATYEACFAGFSANMRKQLRRDDRELRAMGELTLDVARTGAEVREALPDLIALNQERYEEAGIFGAFRDARFTQFHIDVAPRLADAGCVRVMLLKLSGRSIGALYVLIDGHRYLAYQGGQAVAFASNGPGTLLNGLAMQYGIERDRITHFDFGPGEQPYKLRFKPMIEASQLVRAFRPTPLGLALAARSWRDARRTAGGAPWRS